MFRLTMQPVINRMKKKKKKRNQFVDYTYYKCHWNASVSKYKKLHEAHSLQMSVKLTKEVFLVPTRTTWGGFITNFLFSPATMSGFFSLMMLKTLFRSWNRDDTVTLFCFLSMFIKFSTQNIKGQKFRAQWDQLRIKKIKKESSV